MNLNFETKINDHSLSVGIVGLGYVGLPLVIEFCRTGLNVVGFDIDSTKVDALKAGESYIRHIPSENIRKYIVENDNARITTDFATINTCDAVLICVPTPLSTHREPDLSYITKTAESIAPHLSRGTLVVLESTTYPGTTADVLAPILESGSGLTIGDDVFVAYSPEREDPGNPDFSLATVPKVVGADNECALESVKILYKQVCTRVVPVSSTQTAEAVKLVENIFRSINIAMANELKMIFARMGIDIWEVVNAAKTKPFGYMPFYPGPGLGGHCIPIDPFYLTWKAKECGISTRFIELAGEINTMMPEYVVHQTMEAANERSFCLKGAKVLLVGLAYKGNVDDDRESPTYALWNLFEQKGADVSYYDPYCPVVRESRENSHLAGIKSITEANFADYDIAVISTAHDNVDHDQIAESVRMVVDTRGACKPRENVVRA